MNRQRNRKMKWLVRVVVPLLILSAVYGGNDPITISLTHETVVTSPKDRARVKIGVGEEVVITASIKVNWTISGGGKLSPQQVNDIKVVTLTAPDTSATVKITATKDGTSEEVEFEVVEPDGLLMVKRANPAPAILQNPKLAVRYYADVYVTPEDVNFGAISVSEDAVAGVGTLYFSPMQNYPHAGTANPDGTRAWNSMVGHIKNKGTKMALYDTIGILAIPGPPYSAGTFLWAIPWQYKLGETEKIFTTANQLSTMTLNQGKATLNISKAGASHSVTEL